jgi:hypothetical protein
VLLKQRGKVLVEMYEKVPAGEQKVHRGILPRHII